jgi:hypothetical protein
VCCLEECERAEEENEVEESREAHEEPALVSSGHGERRLWSSQRCRWFVSNQGMMERMDARLRLSTFLLTRICIQEEEEEEGELPRRRE